MEPCSDRKERRFRIEKLEERIAPTGAAVAPAVPNPGGPADPGVDPNAGGPAQRALPTHTQHTGRP